MKACSSVKQTFQMIFLDTCFLVLWKAEEEHFIPYALAVGLREGAQLLPSVTLSHWGCHPGSINPGSPNHLLAQQRGSMLDYSQRTAHPPFPLQSSEQQS